MLSAICLLAEASRRRYWGDTSYDLPCGFLGRHGNRSARYRFGRNSFNRRKYKAIRENNNDRFAPEEPDAFDKAIASKQLG